MNDLKFLSIGGATNIEFGGNSCYYKDGDNLLVIDMCESVTKKLFDENAFKDVKNIYVIITHTHFDHVSGLGIFIWYCNFYLNIKPIIIYKTNKYKNTLKKLLKITGVDLKYVDFRNDSNFKINNLKIELCPTSHVNYLQCFGIMFYNNNDKFYYTGDTKDINYIRKLNSDNNVKKIYTEVATETYGVHIKYDDLLDLDKSKLVLMHFDTVELYNRAKRDNFNVAK